MTPDFSKLRIFANTSAGKLEFLRLASPAMCDAKPVTTAENKTAIAEYACGDMTLSLYKTDLNNAVGYSVHLSLTDGLAFDPERAIEFKYECGNEIDWMADAMYGPVWCHPTFGHGFFSVTNETQGLLFRSGAGFESLMVVCGDDFRSFIEGDGSDSLNIYLRSGISGLSSADTPFLLDGSGRTANEASHAAAAAGVMMLGGKVKLREDRRYPEMFEYLGWCSWDALEIRVSEQGLIEKCREFIDKDIPVKWIIVDDMWADVPDLYAPVYNGRNEMFPIMHHAALAGFEADVKRFPNGLKAAVEKVKSLGDFKVGMWHPTTGYWYGVVPNSALAEKYADCLEMSANDRLTVKADAESMLRFFGDWHEFLRSCGVDFMKIDNQSSLRATYNGITSIGKAASALHTALEASVSLNFDNRLINCMGMAAENMWNRPQSAISRTSDDFQPDDRAWFTKHITQCTYNTLYQGQLYVCDYDMWWSGDPQGVKNSTLRAISGGPVYISDRIGESRADVLAPLILDDGKVLRADIPATPADKCVLSDPEKSNEPFIAVGRIGECGLAACYNLCEDNSEVHGKLTLDDMHINNTENRVFYEHFTKTATYPAVDGVEISLSSGDDFRYYLAAAVKNNVAIIGIAEKYNSTAAIDYISDSVIKTLSDGTLVIYTLPDAGKRIINMKTFDETEIKTPGLHFIKVEKDGIYAIK